MPILRTKEIREMSPEDRSRRLGELRTELSKVRTMTKAGMKTRMRMPNSNLKNRL